MVFSYTKADRILKRPEFLKLSKHGMKIHSKHFLAIFCPGRYERIRLGITVTKKIGGAVTRNRIKRFSREFFRLNKHSVAGNWDINIIAKKNAASLTSDQAFLSLQNIFNKISRNFDY